MKLLFKQRFFSWFDSYDIYDEGGRGVFTVEGKLGWGHVLHVLDAGGRHVGTVREKVLTLFEPKFEIFTGADEYIGCITKRFTFFKPKFDIDFNGWQVEGDFWGWDYSVVSPTGETVAVITKELFNWTDTYSIDVVRPENALCALMLVLAIDAEKCSRVFPSSDRRSALFAVSSDTAICPLMNLKLPPRSSAPSSDAVRPFPGKASKRSTSKAVRHSCSAL